VFACECVFASVSVCLRVCVWVVQVWVVRVRVCASVSEFMRASV
jgi:hypothetical protein